MLWYNAEIEYLEVSAIGNLMKKFLSFAAIFLVFLMLTPVFAADSDKIPVIIRYKEADSGHNIAMKQARMMDSDRIELAETKDYPDMRAAAAVVKRSDMEKLRNDPRVERVDLNPTVYASMNDVLIIINATGVHRSLSAVTGAGETVCIIDTGVDYTHPDLGGCNITDDINDGSCSKVIGGFDFVNNDTNPMDDNGHGTHVSGIAAANGTIKGVAPGAKIVALKVLDSAGNGEMVNVEAAVKWCVDNATKYNISVISMSLSTKTKIYDSVCDNITENGAFMYRYLADLTTAAVNKNITVVAASGNSGSTTAIGAPACISSVIPVAATMKNDSIWTDSNRNPKVSLFAPGASVLSTYMGGIYAIKFGTSMATPAVAGAFALMRSYEKQESGSSLEPQYMLSLLNSTGKKIFDAASNRNYSRINVLAAVTKLDNTKPVIIIYSPRNVSTNNRNITLNFSAYDNIALDKCWLQNYSLPNCANTTLNVSEGRNVFFLYANDTNGNVNSSIIEFILDTKAPELAILSPPNNSNYTELNINLSIEVNETNIDRCFYSLNNGQNVTISVCRNASVAALPGSNRLAVFVNDTAGNWNSSTVFFNVTIAGPVVVINSPLSATYSYIPTLNISAFSSTTPYCWYRLNNMTVQLPNCANTTLNATEGVNHLTVYVNNTINESSASVNFTLDTTPPALQFYGPKNETANQSIIGFVLTSNEDLSYALLNFSGIAYSMQKNMGNWTVTLNLTNGNYTYFLKAADMAGNINTTAVYWVIVNTTIGDTQSPALVVASPIQTTYSSTQVSLEYSVSDDHLDRCWYVLNGAETFLPGCVNATLTAVNGNNVLFVYANDTSGNRNVTNINFFVSTPPVGGSSNGGDSSSSGGGSVSSPPSYPKNVTVVFNSSIEKINVILSLPAPLKLSLNRTETSTQPPETVFQIIDVDANTSSPISAANIFFRVPVAWLAENHVNKNSVKLYRLDDNWQPLDTVIIGEDNSSVSYRARTDNFSVFAITGVREKSMQVCAQVITSATDGKRCVTFATPCDVPEGWTAVSSCPEEPEPSVPAASMTTGMAVDTGSLMSLGAFALGACVVAFDALSKLNASLKQKKRKSKKS